MKKIIYTLFIAVALGGCNYHEYVNPKSEKTDEPLEETAEASGLSSVLEDEYDLYYEIDDYTLSRYEPEDGIYLGAYILSNKMINYSIEEFEKKTGNEHLLYSYHLKLGDELPLNWVLECTSQLKIPLIVIEPPDIANPFDIDLLLKTCNSFTLNVPMFIEFYPRPSSLPVKEYIEFFRQAREMFAEYAPNCAFIFSVSSDKAVDEMLYYPGNSFTDWVGLNIYMPVSDDDKIYSNNLFENIDMVYYNFQKSKPLMITQLAVSHYTSRNHTYYTMQAAEAITNIYMKIADSYPRIKGIIYMDFNNVELKRTGIRDNFSITDSETVLKSYSQVIKNDPFIAKLSSNDTAKKASQLIKSPYPAKKTGENFYMPDIIYGFPQHLESGIKISDFLVDHRKKHIIINLKK